MYKRAARVLFVCMPGDERAALAARLTAGIAPGWMEARHAAVDEVDGGALAWADLVIALDARARDRCPVLPPGGRLRHWDLPDLPPEETKAEIRRRLASMLGGLHMLARLEGGSVRQD
jgi:protein-tyrosine-phosphatase